MKSSSTSFLRCLPPAKVSPPISLDGKEDRVCRKQTEEREKLLLLTPRPSGGSEQEVSLHRVRDVGLYEKNKDTSNTEDKGKEKNREVQERLGRRKKKMERVIAGYHIEGGSGCSSQASEEEERERLPRRRDEEVHEEDMATELIQRLMNLMLAAEEGTCLPLERVEKSLGERLHPDEGNANPLGETRRRTPCEQEKPSGEKEMKVRGVDLTTTKGFACDRRF